MGLQIVKWYKREKISLHFYIITSLKEDILKNSRYAVLFFTVLSKTLPYHCSHA